MTRSEGLGCTCGHLHSALRSLRDDKVGEVGCDSGHLHSALSSLRDDKVGGGWDVPAVIYIPCRGPCGMKRSVMGWIS